MAIREFSPDGTPRAKIAFVGEYPESYQDWFKTRNFECVPSTPEELRSANAGLLDAVVWTQDPKKLNSVLQELLPIVASLLDHDVRIYIRLASARSLIVNTLIEGAIPVARLLRSEWETIPDNRRERENSFLLPCVYIIESGLSWPEVATLVCDRPAGPSPKSDFKVDEGVLLKEFGSNGHAERLVLLKRAFSDCSGVQLTLLDGGMSGAPVFKAYASLSAALVGQGPKGAYPHLYFAKLGPRKKIVDEYDKYCGHIFEYVPFHLGPRLRRDRCNLGSRQGILVGDFVEGAESLIACARGLRCGHAVSSLFGKTLGGWRKQRVVDANRSLSGYLEKKWQSDVSNVLITLPHARAELVRQLGGNPETAPLKAIFETHGDTSPLIAPAHGDMHATNVLVRHGDAILIDFEKLEQHYPLTYDPASLEGGILVEGFVEDLKSKKFRPDEIVGLIEPLYEEAALRSSATTHCLPGHSAEWYYDAVNQIRTLSWAAENEPNQYALTLALCLIRKGCNVHPNLESEEASASRAIAFLFGERILRLLNRKSGETKDSA